MRAVNERSMRRVKKGGLWLHREQRRELRGDFRGESMEEETATSARELEGGEGEGGL